MSVLVGIDDARDADAYALDREDGVRLYGDMLDERMKVGAERLKLGGIYHCAKRLAALVELVVAERYSIVAHSVHKLNHRDSLSGVVVDKGVARDAVASIDNKHVAELLILVDERSELRHRVYVGVHIVGCDDIDMRAIVPLCRSTRGGKEE